MPDAFTTPDDLIAELVEAAMEFAPADAVTFQTEARDELATYREGREEERRERFLERERPPERERPREREGPDDREPPRERQGTSYRGPRHVVPDRYASRAEVFIVFETFVRFFLDPVLTAADIPDFLINTGREQAVERIAFTRFGEEAIPTSILDLSRLADDARVMRAYAAELGLTLFGDTFREADFWRGDA